MFHSFLIRNESILEYDALNQIFQVFELIRYDPKKHWIRKIKKEINLLIYLFFLFLLDLNQGPSD